MLFILITYIKLIAIFIDCNKEECPAAVLPTTAALMSRCHRRCRKASTVLPWSPPRCRHCRRSCCCRCRDAAAALLPPPFCCAATTTLPPRTAAAKPLPRAVANAALVFIVVVAAVTALSRCQRRVVNGGHFGPATETYCQHAAKRHKTPQNATKRRKIPQNVANDR